MKKKFNHPPKLKSVQSPKKSNAGKLIVPFIILTIIFLSAYFFIPTSIDYNRPPIKPAYEVFKRGMYDSSKVLIDELKKDPLAQLNDSLYLLESDYYLKQGKTVEAIKALEEGVLLTDSTSARLFFKIGKLQLNEGKVVNALDDFFSGLVLAPTNDSAWYYCGYIQAAHTNDYENALKSFEQALSVNPDLKYSFNVLLWKGISYQELGYQVNAIDQFNQAIKLTRNNDLARYYKAKSMYISGDSIDACQVWNTLLKEQFELAKFAIDAYCQ